MVQAIRGIGIFLCSLLLLSACSDSAPPVRRDPEIRKLTQEVDNIHFAIKEGYLLKSSTERDKEQIKKLLLKLKLGLQRLQEAPRHEGSFKILRNILKAFEKFQFLRDDQSQLQSLLYQTHALAERRARQQGLVFSDLTWTLFEYNFSEGIFPFSSRSTGIPWDSKWALDQPHAFVKNGGKTIDAWLISPSFNLTQIRDPSFTFNHTLLVDRNTNFSDDFNETLIKNQAFKVLVSTDFTGDPSSANWTEVEINPLPVAMDFHTETNEPFDLKPFLAKKVTIAFRLNVDTRELGRHYITWQINHFELQGAGDLGSIEEPPRTLLKHEFTSSELFPFQAFTPLTSGAHWAPFAFSGKYKFAKAEGNENPSETWLLSPRYQIREQEDLKLFIQETVRNPDWANFKILVSDNYEGGDPRQAQWQELERPTAVEVPPDAWKDLVTGPFPMGDYRNKDIVIAFQYLHAGGLPPTAWEIGFLAFEGKGNELSQEALTLEPEQTGEQP